jgi:hypothetical protein
MAEYLHPVKHANFLRNITSISKRSHVAISHLHSLSILEVCDKDEQTWVLSFKDVISTGRAGLIIVGDSDVSPMMKLTGIAATLLRNFKDAKVISVGMVISVLFGNSDEDIDADILLIPDLHLVDMDYTKKEVTKLYAFLLERFIADKVTIGYVSDLLSLRKSYGKDFHDLLVEQFDLSHQTVDSLAA